MAKPVITKVDKEHVRSSLPFREHGAHKWGVGSVLIVAGSPSYPGAAMLASRAAGRAGAGIVQLATSRGVIGSIASGIPEVAFVPLPETESTSGARKAVEAIVEKAERGKAVVIGPGLGDDEASANLLAHLLGFATQGATRGGGIGFGALRQEPAASTSGEAESPLLAIKGLTAVVDADGLGWLAKQENWWEPIPAGRLVLTPHFGEMSELTGTSTEEIAKDPASVAQEAAAKWGQLVVLKGGATVISDGKTTIVADRESVALATAGSGDVLAGTIGGFLAQGMRALDATTLAIYLGPRAAARVASRLGDAGVVATDLPDAYAEELRTLRGN